MIVNPLWKIRYLAITTTLTLCLCGWVAHQRVYRSLGVGFDFCGTDRFMTCFTHFYEQLRVLTLIFFHYPLTLLLCFHEKTTLFTDRTIQHGGIWPPTPSSAHPRPTN